MSRKKATDYILKWVGELLPGSKTVETYKDFLKDLTDDGFKKFIDSIEANGGYLPLVVPNFNKSKLVLERNLKIAKSLGIEFFQHLTLTDQSTGVTYKTAKKYLVFDINVRRQAQHITKKMSVAKGNQSRDDLTNQAAGSPATGGSKAASLSFPEMHVLKSLGLDSTIIELIKLRGGDQEAYNAYVRQTVATGGADLESILELDTSVKVTETLGIYLQAEHLDNNLRNK